MGPACRQGSILVTVGNHQKCGKNDPCTLSDSCKFKKVGTSKRSFCPGSLFLVMSMVVLINKQHNSVFSCLWIGDASVLQ